MDVVSFVTMTTATSSSGRHCVHQTVYLSPLFFLISLPEYTRNPSTQHSTITFHIDQKHSRELSMAPLTIESPQLMGVTGDSCAPCGSLHVPLYNLPCHESDDIHCRDCLTKTFYKDRDDFVRCPHPSCGRPAGFKPLDLLEHGLHLNNDFYDEQCIDKIREQPEVMNNLIAFTREEAEVTLQHIYSLVEDQSMDPIALGGIPGWITAGAQNSLQASFDSNLFVGGFLSDMKEARKQMTTPYELDEDLTAVLNNILLQHARRYHGDELAMRVIDMEDGEAVLAASLDDINEIKENWELIISKWVELLTWRHLERLAPPEGGAVERMDFSF
jgi:hypothetical protein